jgi:transposase-like protein
MKNVKIQITREMVDAVFSKPQFLNKFPDAEKAREVCEMRLAGATYKEIAKRFGVSEYYGVHIVDKVVRLYMVFLAGERA